MGVTAGVQKGVTVPLSAKQQQFNAAMELYTGKSRYRIFSGLVAAVNVSLQVYFLLLILPREIGIARQLLSLGMAYLIADFINGLVHMYMDNNDRYESLAGPLIAGFHLHHKTPQYRKRNLIFVYVVESGSKIWLAVYLLLLLPVSGMGGCGPFLLHVLVYIGIFSSLAEVSHYLCHSSTSVVAGFLARCGLLLSKRHHAQHHLSDNSNYAFLNGISDPLINLIAAAWYSGYKQNTDLHFAGYSAGDTDSR